MAYIRRRKGSWQTVIRVQGYPPITKTFKTKIDAQRYSRDLENKLFREKHDIAKKKFPIIHDQMSNTFKSEQQMIRENEVKAKGIYDHLTRNKNKKNVKVVKNKPIAKRRESLKAKLIPSVPMNLDLNLKISKQPAADAAENILKKIDNERNKVDPDTFKGLGAFFLSEI